MALMEHVWSDVVAPTTFHGGLSKRVHAFLFSSREVRWRRQPGAPGNSFRRLRWESVNVELKLLDFWVLGHQGTRLLGSWTLGYETFGSFGARV